MKKILVVGSINMDCVIRLPRRPRPGETVFCSTVSHVPGGKGANQAYALGRMGTGVSLIGAVGQDEFGRISLANLRAAGVDTTGVRVSADEDTGRAFIEVEDDGQNSIIVLGGANTHRNPAGYRDGGGPPGTAEREAGPPRPGTGPAGPAGGTAAVRRSAET